MKGIPDSGGLYSYPDRLAWEAGEVGDREHPEMAYGEPDFDEKGLPIHVKDSEGNDFWVD